MNPTTNEAASFIPSEEVERRLAEYRRLGFERRAPAQVVYLPPHHACPWPECDRRIAGIHFQLEQMDDQALQEQLLASWWQGPGLVGRCPGCSRYVLFALTSKQAVSEPGRIGAAILPDAWHEKAHLVEKLG